MNKILKKSFIQVTLVLFIFLLIPISSSEVKADIIPVVKLDFNEEIFYPTTDGNNSYYMIEPGYTTTSADYSGDSATAYRSTNDGNVISYSTSPINDGESLNIPNELSSQTRDTRNPFLEDEDLPRFVNITAGDVNFTSKYLDTLSLHLDHDVTFFLNHSLVYNVFYNINETFLLDVYVRNPNSNARMTLGSTLFPGTTYTASDKETILIQPDTTQTQMFTLDTSTIRDSIVTLSPHALNIKSDSKVELPVDQIFTDSIEQGTCYNRDNATLLETNQEVMSFKFFNVPVIAGKAYEVFFFSDNIYQYTTTGCDLGGIAVLHTDDPNNYGQSTGTIDQDGRKIEVLHDGYLNFSLIAMRAVFKDYTFYVQESEPFPTIPADTPLIFGQNMTLVEGFYNFTLAQASLFAVNRTNLNGIGYDFNWFRYDSSFAEWVPITTDGNFMSDLDETGDLLGGSGEIDTTWIYLPAGTYRIEALDNTNDFDTNTFHFTKVPVSTFTGSTDINIENGGIYAYELPLQMNKINYFNVSTSAHDNLSVVYDYAFIGKYNRLGDSDTFSSFESTLPALGNQQVNGIWQDYNSNLTMLGTTILPSRPHQNPIMIFRPVSANGFINSTNIPVTEFSTTLTITTFVRDDDHPLRNIANYAQGYFIPITNTLSSSSPLNFVFSSELVDQSNLLYGVPLSLTANNLYNLTVILTGNYTEGPLDLNATINSGRLRIHAGNLYDVRIPNTGVSIQTNTTDKYSTLFLSVTSTGYLYFDISRVDPAGPTPLLNGTITISLSTVPVKVLNLQNTNLLQSWNGTINEAEVSNPNPLWSVVGFNPAGNGGDLSGPLLLLGGLAVVAVVVIGGVIFIRNKRGPSGKFP